MAWSPRVSRFRSSPRFAARSDASFAFAALVPRFRSSHHSAARSFANFGLAALERANDGRAQRWVQGVSWHGYARSLSNIESFRHLRFRIRAITLTLWSDGSIWGSGSAGPLTT